MGARQITIFSDKLVPALLALEDGSLFGGYALGHVGISTGEVVFNTAMSGYQEVLSDPSYAEQIITFTYPHIGNVGINAEDMESAHVWAKGVILRELPTAASNWRAKQSLKDWLLQQQVVGIAGIDTRRLTHLLREKGALSGCIMSANPDPDIAVERARQATRNTDKDLATVVSTSTVYKWAQGSYNKIINLPRDAKHIVVYDFGVKYSILRMLVDRGCRVTVVPAQTTVDEVLALQPHGVVLANGPGDPAACDTIIHHIKQLLNTKLPVLGICLGHQLLALAYGAQTFKMKFGHHGANHPVLDIATGKVYITSQNHNFAVDENTLPDCLTVTHRSLFDNTIQGLRHQHNPVMSLQGHPEANPGPTEANIIFDDFLKLC